MRCAPAFVPSQWGHMGWRLCCAASVVMAMLLVVGCANAPGSRPGAPVSTRASSIPRPSSAPVANPESGDNNTAASSTTAQSSASNPSSEREDATAWQESGLASWYGPRFHGKRTASGERFDANELTAAHKTLPFGTRVRVKSMVNGKEVVVRINDRGPFIKGRIIDLSQAAAQALGLSGIKQVTIERLR
jgi:rare lipoprotein A